MHWPVPSDRSNRQFAVIRLEEEQSTAKSQWQIASREI
jgi:hypothetical protein